ncbi:iron chelate uptake ABC transporter family permease subunit [Vibrio sp. PP-XX7]
MGDDLAAGLGEKRRFSRRLAGLGAILLCGATTAICGPIGFVGLVVPHFCRLLVGVDHPMVTAFFYCKWCRITCFS